jgi:hypothetical protein
MKQCKYKLIKRYPGSDPVGTIVTGYGKDGWYSKGAGDKTYDWTLVVYNPEFWEEVIEKDYEILSYIKKGSTTCTTTKRRGGENHEEFWNIYSVKRLSDGEVFTIGDTVRMYEHGPIKTIETITTNSIRSTLKQGVWFTYNSGSSHMDHAIKQKQPIYLTHDGKYIFEGDTYWCVNTAPHLWSLWEQTLKQNTQLTKGVLAFLTEEEAKNYIIENKPSLYLLRYYQRI